MFDPTIKMSIQSQAGDYYVASRSISGVWTIDTSPTLVFLDDLPDKWDESSTKWERDNSYVGIFRSKGNDSFDFTGGGRAILQHIFRNEGIRGYGTLNIHMIKNDSTGITYPVFYASQFDFKTYRDLVQEKKVVISTLDGNLIKNLRAYGDTKFNVPIWRRIGSTWERNDSEGIWHNGIRLLYNATFTSGASTANPIQYNLEGFGDGEHGVSPHDGYHTIPAMNEYNVTQNNGSTTYIGNTILATQIVQGRQSAYMNEINFDGGGAFVSSSTPFSSNNFCVQSHLPATSLFFSVSGEFTSSITNSAGAPAFLKFVIFEIGPDNQPPVVSGKYQIFATIHSIYLPTAVTPSPGVFQSPPFAASLSPDKVYVFAIIYDGDGYAIFGGAPCVFVLSNLELSILSNYDYGASGIPIDAPKFPGSTTLGFRLHTLLEKLVPYMDTVSTDQYGFPIPVTTDFAGVSTFLSDPDSYAGGDCWPYQILLTSSYCMHNLSGQSYLTISFNELFDFCKKQLGCGAYITGNTVYIEPLSTIFDSSTMILDLGYDVTGLEIFQITEGVGANLKLGYSAADTNSNFGVDPFNTQLYFNTPASAITGTMDYQESSILTERYAIEIVRSQKASQPIGSSINPENPSRDNQTIALYCEGFMSGTERTITNPDNISLPIYPYDVKMYSDAQNTDPTAATAVYISGLYYPQDAVNINLSPCRALNREVGALLHSVLDQMDSESLVFRNTYIMQMDNTTLSVPGIESNLMIGAGFDPVIEFGDKTIGDLPTQLFRSIGIKVKSKYPVNLHQILNSNPNGYARCFWKNDDYTTTEYKFFIDKATQYAANGMAVEFVGRLTPDMVI